MEKEEVTKLIATANQEYKSFSEQIQELKIYLEGPNPNTFNAKLGLRDLEACHVQSQKYHKALAVLKPEHQLIDVYKNLRLEYYEIAANADGLINPIIRNDPIANSTLNASNITVTQRHDAPKLPDIKITTFEGKANQWLSFKNQFTALVHSRTDLSDFVKHTQLLNALTGSAKLKIVALEPSADNYAKAWKTLTDAYDHKRLVIVDHLNALIDLPKVPAATVEGVSQLLDAIRQHYTMVEQIVGAPVSCEHLVVRIAERCIPQRMLSRWQERLDIDQPPTLKEFCAFLQANIFNLQGLEHSAAESKLKGDVKRKFKSNFDRESHKVAKFESRSFITSSTNINVQSCSKCNEPHPLYRCPQIQSWSNQQKWDFVKSKNLCRNCLRKHPGPCPSLRRCKKCNRSHHTLLHNDRNPQQQGLSSSSLVTAKDSKSSKL